MKKLATVVFALLLGASLSFAQAGGGTTKTDDTQKADKGEKKGKKSKKGSKKSKKGEKGGESTTPPPK